MTIKIELQNNELIKEFLTSVKSQRTTGRGPLTDSWVISKHIKEFSRKSLGIDLEDTDLTAIHLFVSGDNAIVSGVNFKDTLTIESLSGRNFSANTLDGKTSFKFGKVVEKFQAPMEGTSPKTVPLSFFFNSVVFEIEKSEDSFPDFYKEVNFNQELLKELGRPVLSSGEPCLDSQMMDFERALPEIPLKLKTDIAKFFVSLI